MKKSIISITVTALMLAGPYTAFADWGNHGGGHPGVHGQHAYFHYHDHPHYGYRVNAFYPDEYYPISVGADRYYYDDGVYYNYLGGAYVVAAPPAGAVVSAIPSDFQPVVINGTTYYTNNGTYYAYTSNGYQVVNAPQASSALVINVPNNKGGYVAVTLRRSGNGFVGPQGEFYASFPQVSQLRITYGR